MSNIKTYKEIKAFHPGRYIERIIEDRGETQAEFALRMGVSAKTLSELVNGNCDISENMACKLSAMLGISVETWLNLQAKYDAALVEMERTKKLDDQIPVFDKLDYSYFAKLADLPLVKNIRDKIKNLCSFLTIHSLDVLAQKDALASFRSEVCGNEDVNRICANAWLYCVISLASKITVANFDAQKFQEKLPVIKSYMAREFNANLIDDLKSVFSECGVIFIYLPHLKNSHVNGVVKWCGPERVIIGMNDYRKNVDTFWFSLFHEIGHVMQQKHKHVFLSFDEVEQADYDEKLEKEADHFANEQICASVYYNAFVFKGDFSRKCIQEFAASQNVPVSFIAGRLAHDGYITWSFAGVFRKSFIKS